VKFTEAQLENVFAELLANEGYPHHLGNTLNRAEDEVILEDDLRLFLATHYAKENITTTEIDGIILQLKTLPASDLYESNKRFMRMLSDGFILKREDHSQKDIYINLVDYSETDNNIYKFVNQLEIVGTQKRIPDGILYVNGLPLVVFEFKSAIREEATLWHAWDQLTNRYKRDIPQLFIYNTFCVISDGVNNKAGSFFTSYEFYYAWRRVSGLAKDVDGIDSMFTLVQGMLHKNRLRDIIRNFIYLADSSKKDEKIVCRYPQYYAARALYNNIKQAQKPNGNGKGGTYFGATGCGKSFTMLFLTRLLMKSTYFKNPTIVLITDRTDLDTQLSEQFTNAKNYVGDNGIVSVESRSHLRDLMQGCESGGVFLTTIHKFTEDLELLTNRTNVICISDEAHRSQTNLDQKIKVTEKGVKKTYGFAKYLHDSLPNATFVGFTGTPIDATLDVFGKVVDSYTMTESVKDEITVRIVYEGRAAKVILNNSELQKIETYYQEAAEAGANDYQVEESKKQSANMYAILGDPDVLQKIAVDFVNHYENRINEGATVKGKAMFVCPSRPIAYAFYKNVIALRPEWADVKQAEDGAALTDKDKRDIKPMEDYIGIKKAMNMALAKYGKGDQDNFEDIESSLVVVRNHLDLLGKFFHKFDNSKYFNGSALDQLNTLNKAAEFAQVTKKAETRFMGLVKRLKAAYDICAGSEKLTQKERDYTHFYLAVRSIVFKLTKGDAPDTAQMNDKVREMIKDALQSDGVEEIFKIGENTEAQQDIFDDDYLAKIDKIKLPNTKIKLLQKLLAKAIGEMKKVNKVKGIDFTKKMDSLVAKYNDRTQNDTLTSDVLDDMATAITEMIMQVRDEFNAGDELGIDFEEKAFYDILLELCAKYDFTYPDEKLIELAKKVKELVDSQAKFPDWSKRDDIKAALKVGLILLLDEFGYPPVERDEVYEEIFSQAENFKKNRK